MKQKDQIDTRVAIEASWRKVYDFDSETHAERLFTDAPSFVEYAWDKFDEKVVMQMLICEKPMYSALKPILFAGFCAWVVCPHNRPLRRHAMRRVGLRHMQKAERSGRAIFAGRDVPNHDLLGDIIGRARVLGHDFYSDFYYPIGGLAGISHAATPLTISKNLESGCKFIDIAVSMMQVADFHAKVCARKRHFKMSESKGYELIRKIHGTGRGVIGIDLGKMEKVWRSFRNNSALIYSASTLICSNGDNMLNLIRTGKADYARLHGLMLPWMRRARYAAEVLLGKSHMKEIGFASARVLPDLDAEETPQPYFSVDEQALITDEFDDLAILGNRQRDVIRERLSRRGSRRV